VSSRLGGGHLDLLFYGATVAASGDFSYARAVREWAFVQVPLLPLAEFRKAALERGLMKISPFDDRPWETLDREGMLPAVAYALHGLWHYDQLGSLENRDLLIRDEHGYTPWEELRTRARERHGAQPTALYGHWQLLSLAAVVDELSTPTPLSSLSEGLDAFAQAKVTAASTPIDGHRLRAVSAANRAEELVLTKVQNLFMPSVRGGRYLASPVTGLTDDAAEWTMDAQARFDYASAAVDCGVTPDDLARQFEVFATQAHWIDPLERWFHLADQVKRGERERLTGDALRAPDLYDAARVIRLWHAQLVDEALPDVDELFGIDPRAAKRRMYGTDDLGGNCEALPALLEHYGLYPWRVQLIAEGESDIAMLDEILDVSYGLSFGALGIHAFALRGADIPANAELILGAVRVYCNYYLLLFDNEGRARELIEALVRAGHIEGVSDGQRKQALAEARSRTFADDAERSAALSAARKRAQSLEDEPGAAPEFLIWKQDIEADNFTVAEACDVVNANRRRHGRPHGLRTRR
jgi:hypothetical protein